MKKKTMWIGGSAIALALVIGSAGVAVAVTDAFDDDDNDTTMSQVERSDDNRPNSNSNSNSNTDSDDLPITDAEREAVSEAALAEVDGTVTDIDRSDDADHAWEVEVLLADGLDVDVELDADYEVTFVDRD